MKMFRISNSASGMLRKALTHGVRAGECTKLLQKRSRFRISPLSFMKNKLKITKKEKS